MRRIALASVVAAVLVPAAALAAVKFDSGSQVVSDRGAKKPFVESLSPSSADGNHVAAVFSESGSQTFTLSGRVLSPSGAPRGESVPWSPENADVRKANAAVNGAGKQGIVVWRQDDPASDKDDELVVRRFDARTAATLGPPIVIARTTALFAVEAYRDGYAIIHSRRTTDGLKQVLQFLDADGALDGEPREIADTPRAFFAELYRSRSANRMVLTAYGPFGNSILLQTFAPNGTSIAKRVSIRDEQVVDVAHAAGGAFMTVWRRSEKSRLFLRRLTSKGRLGPPLPLSAESTLAEVAFDQDRGVLVHRVGGDGCRFKAIELTVSGRQVGAANILDADCDGARPRVALTDQSVEANAAGRFLLTFTALDPGNDARAYAAPLRVG